MQEALRALRAEYFDKWLDRHGLGLLGVGHGVNDNGILFLVYFLILSFIYDETGEFFEEDRARFKTAVDKLRVRDENGKIVPGYFNRRPDDMTPEAHDNYVAIVSGAHVFGFPEIIEEICEAAETNGGSFANQAPGAFIFRQLRQGSDIAFYQAMSDQRPPRVPQILNMAWLVGGLAVNAFFSDASSKNLGFLRVFVMTHKFTTKGMGLPVLYSRALQLGLTIWTAVVQFKGGPLRSFEQYFSAVSPYRRIWKLQ